MTKTVTDITWPSKPPLDAEVRQKFAAALNELLREHKISHMDLAAKLFGKDKDGQPNRPQMVRDWCTADKFPNAGNGVMLAKAFKVPLSRLLKNKGPLITAVQKRTSPKNIKVPTEPPPLDLPKNAKPLAFDMKDFRGDPRFANITISGTAEVDIALGIIALIRRK
jgi:hypothetical protein